MMRIKIIDDENKTNEIDALFVDPETVKDI